MSRWNRLQAQLLALTIYDMLKPIDELLVIESVKLLAKSGGMKDFYEKCDKPLKAVVIVISDSASKGERSDKSASSLLKGFRVVALSRRLQSHT